MSADSLIKVAEGKIPIKNKERFPWNDFNASIIMARLDKLETEVELLTKRRIHNNASQ